MLSLARVQQVQRIRKEVVGQRGGLTLMGGCISLEAVLLALSDQVYIFELHWGIIHERLWSLQNSG